MAVGSGRHRSRVWRDLLGIHSPAWLDVYLGAIAIAIAAYGVWGLL